MLNRNFCTIFDRLGFSSGGDVDGGVQGGCVVGSGLWFSLLMSVVCFPLHRGKKTGHYF